MYVFIYNSTFFNCNYNNNMQIDQILIVRKIPYSYINLWIRELCYKKF